MKVYLSSTLNDLGPERQAVKEVLGGECTVVESYTADERSVRESCCAEVADCDLYIGIIGLRYGFTPPGGVCSITEMEYEEACARKVPTLVFIKDADEIKSGFHDAVTNENPRERIEAFRHRLTCGAEFASRGAMFRTPEDLKSHVLKAYFRLAQRERAPKPKLIDGRPYPGLRAFRPNEADRFFGRDSELESLMDRLLARGDRFLALIGASGSGKSSLVYAGLIPKLTAGPVIDGKHWVPVTMSPLELGDDPFQSLAVALRNKFPDAGWRIAELAQHLLDSPSTIAAVANEALADDVAHAQMLLFVDQFEEVFAATVDASARVAFFELLAAAVRCPLLRVVIAMRDDFYAHWPKDETATSLLRAGHFPVSVPGPAALEKMIAGPARAAGLRFSPQLLLQRILDETGTAPGALALAEFALAQLYDRRQDDALTQTAYEAMGGVAGAIEGLAEDAVRRAERELRRAGGKLGEEDWSRLFTAIASVEEKGQQLVVVRRRATALDLPGAALTLAQHLVDMRLLVVSGGSAAQPAIYEVGHEAVFSHWRRFKDWYGRYAEHLAVSRQAERASAEWARAGRPHNLRWGWERQKPALEALRRLCHLPSPGPSADFADSDLVGWPVLQVQLPESALRSFLHPEPLSMLDELAFDETSHQRREEIGLRLNQFGDPRRGVGLDGAGLPDFSWVDGPAGELKMGADAQESFAVAPFKLARYPVTWTQYSAFLEATDGYINTSWWEGRPSEVEPAIPRWAFPSYPVVNASWYDAVAYCRWLSARLGIEVRLPTEWEWQWAAVAATGQTYPWFGNWNPSRTNSSESGIGRTVAVGMYPLGCSSFGIDDMVGNICEWCLRTTDEPINTSAQSHSSRVLRGGSWYDGAKDLCAWHRLEFPADFRHSGGVGFRLCRGHGDKG